MWQLMGYIEEKGAVWIVMGMGIDDFNGVVGDEVLERRH